MIMKFVYIQQQWEGCAKNIWLNVDYEKKSYTKVISSWCFTGQSNVFCLPKRDIEKMITELKRNDFTEED